ncbi:MAG TPA: hypothetical protein DDZ11_01710 [Lentisphaeria bacterium]|nr:hypothetical protein [Lentisphaeria bacterium]
MSAFRIGDFDADAVFAGVFSEPDLSGSHAAGVGEDVRSEHGGGVFRLRRGEDGEVDGNVCGGFAVRIDELNGDGIGEEFLGFALLFAAGKFCSDDIADGETFVFGADGNDFEVIVADLFSCTDFNGCDSGDVGFRGIFFRDDGGAVNGNEEDVDAGDGARFCLSSDELLSFRETEDFDAEFFFKVLAGESALVVTGFDFDF